METISCSRGNVKSLFMKWLLCWRYNTLVYPRNIYEPTPQRDETCCHCQVPWEISRRDDFTPWLSSVYCMQNNGQELILIGTLVMKSQAKWNETALYRLLHNNIYQYNVLQMCLSLKQPHQSPARKNKLCLQIYFRKLKDAIITLCTLSSGEEGFKRKCNSCVQKSNTDQEEEKTPHSFFWRNYFHIEGFFMRMIKLSQHSEYLLF